MSEFQVVRTDTSSTIDELHDIEIVDTANPFGNEAITVHADFEGDKFGDLQRGVPIRIDAREFTGDGQANNTFTERFSGYIVEVDERDQSGERLEITIYSFDQLLRSGEVSNDQTGNTIFEALEDIITTDTSITWEPANVSVGDEQELTQSLRGENIENALRILSNKSTNEAFGVNSDLEFFFRDRETEKVDVDIDDSNWVNYDIPKRGKQTLNEVTVVYAGGDERVTVDNSDKLDLQDSLGTDRPVGFSDTVVREEIDEFEDAYDLAQQILSDRTETLTGTVTTTADLLDATPGDTINIEISPRGIDGEFRIAEIQYTEYLTTITIVEKRGNQDELLVRMSDSIKRVEQRNYDRDGIENKVTSTNISVETDTTVSPTPDRERLTNSYFNAVADGWRGESNLDISSIVVGDSNADLSRTNTDLDNQTDTQSATETLVGDVGVEYSATFTSQDIQELGLKDSNGDLYYRAIFEEATTVTDISIELTIDNNDDFVKAVVTTGGQETIRDIIADNTPNSPDTYAYGSDNSPPFEGDTTLGNEQFTSDLERFLIQSADTNAEWEEIVSPPNDQPYRIDSDRLESTIVCNTIEGEDADRGTGSVNEDDGNYSGGTAQGKFATVGEGFLEWDISFNHDIPASEVGVQVRLEHLGSFTEWQISFNGIVLDEGSGGTIGPQWIDFSEGGFFNSGFDGYETEGGTDLEAGETYVLRLEPQENGDASDVVFDVVAVYDQRFESDLTFDNTNDGSGGFLDGPERFANQEISFETARTRRNVTEADFTSTWNNTDNDQYIEIANDGSNFTRFDNADTGSTTFGSAETNVDTNINLGRFSSTTNQTPINGNEGQNISEWELFANPDAILVEDIGVTNTRAIVPAGTQTGTTILEGGQKSGSTLLTRALIPEFEILSNMIVLSAERVEFR